MRIIVADASDGSDADENATVCRQAGGDVLHLNIPSPRESAGVTKNYRDRMDAAMEHVRTPYIAMCADDDLIFSECANRCVRFLERNDDFIACQGTYAGFGYSGAGVDITSIVYDSPSIDGIDVASRLLQLYSHYEAPFYAVYRSDVQREILAGIPGDLERFLLVEATQSAATAIRGKVKRIEGLYYLRNMTVAPHPRDVEGWNQWMAYDFDGFYAAYRRHRARMLSIARASSSLSIDEKQLGTAIDMAFVLYVGLEFHLGYWLDEYLSKHVSSPEERARLRSPILRRLLGIHEPASAPANPEANIQEASALRLAQMRLRGAAKLRSAQMRLRGAAKQLVLSVSGTAGLEAARRFSQSIRRPASRPATSGGQVAPSPPPRQPVEISPVVAARFTADELDRARASLEALIKSPEW